MKGNYRHGYCSKKKISPTWECWRSMKQRCTNPKRKDYKFYGERGIKVCEKWLSFEGFLEDMGEKPEGMTIDRIDNNSGYFKENCRWASSKQQWRNRRSNKWLTIDGVTMCQQDWCRTTGVTRASVTWRLKSGWSIKEALMTPTRTYTPPNSRGERA